MVSHKSIAALLLVAMLAGGTPQKAFAADVTELQKFSFGKWAVTSNNFPQFVTVHTNGSYSSSPAMIYMGVPPQEGVYQVTNLPPFVTPGNVVVTVNSNMHSGGAPDFTIDTFTTSIGNTDASGTTTLYVGATARTTGTSDGYPDATYTGSLHIEVNL